LREFSLPYSNWEYFEGQVAWPDTPGTQEQHGMVVKLPTERENRIRTASIRIGLPPKPSLARHRWILSAILQ